MTRNPDYIEVADRLEYGANFLETHEWGKGDYAYDKDGLSVEPFDGRAVYFCAFGACEGGREISINTQTDINLLSVDVSGRGLAVQNDKYAKSKKEIQTFMRRLAYVARLRAKNRGIAA